MDLFEFLKTYSTIPNQFITDFHDMLTNNNVIDQFKIDLDVVSKWLGVRKHSIKRTLISSYHENIDFQSTSHKSIVGRPNIKIMLTPDCFKRLCMLSKSPKAEEVRSYYLQLEQMIDKHKDIIIAEYDKRIKILENNQKPIVSTNGSGVIYILKIPESENDSKLGLTPKYKIGRTINIKQRLTNHNSSHADDLELVGQIMVDDVERVEHCIKSITRPFQYRKQKEIYQVHVDVLKNIIEGCSKVLLDSNKIYKKLKNTTDQNIIVKFDTKIKQ